MLSRSVGLYLGYLRNKNARRYLRQTLLLPTYKTKIQHFSWTFTPCFRFKYSMIHNLVFEIIKTNIGTDYEVSMYLPIPIEYVPTRYNRYLLNVKISTNNV